MAKAEYCSALHAAVQCGEPSQCRKLLDHGASVSAKDMAGRTPLHWAVVFGKAEVAKMILVNTPRRLLQAGDRHGRTALHYAAGLNRLELARVMLERGAQADLADNKGVRPLHLAAEQSDPGMVELLLSRGADMLSRDSLGMLPLEYALRQGSLEAAELLAVGEESAKVVPVNVDVCVAVESAAASKPSGQHSATETSERCSSERATKAEVARKRSALEDLLTAWKGAESSAKSRRKEKSRQLVAVESALDAWRSAESERKAVVGEEDERRRGLEAAARSSCGQAWEHPLQTAAATLSQDGRQTTVADGAGAGNQCEKNAKGRPSLTSESLAQVQQGMSAGPSPSAVIGRQAGAVTWEQVKSVISGLRGVPVPAVNGSNIPPPPMSVKGWPSSNGWQNPLAQQQLPAVLPAGTVGQWHLAAAMMAFQALASQDWLREEDTTYKCTEWEAVLKEETSIPSC